MGNKKVCHAESISHIFSVWICAPPYGVLLKRILGIQKLSLSTKCSGQDGECQTFL